MISFAKQASRGTQKLHVIAIEQLKFGIVNVLFQHELGHSSVRHIDVFVASITHLEIAPSVIY